MDKKLTVTEVNTKPIKYSDGLTKTCICYDKEENTLSIDQYACIGNSKESPSKMFVTFDNHPKEEIVKEFLKDTKIQELLLTASELEYGYEQHNGINYYVGTPTKQAKQSWNEFCELFGNLESYYLRAVKPTALAVGCKAQKKILKSFSLTSNH
jgi:hypothetical protein